MELREPNVFLGESYRSCRLQGLDPGDKSFLFRLIHTLLPSKERIHHLTQQGSFLCWSNYNHLFYQCAEAGQAVLRCIKSYDGNLSEEKCSHTWAHSNWSFLAPLCHHSGHWSWTDLGKSKVEENYILVQHENRVGDGHFDQKKVQSESITGGS